MKRLRPSESLRPLYLKCGLNGQSPGSSYLEQGLTKVVATVYGPRENPRAEGESVSSGVLEVFVQFAPFSSRVRAQVTREETMERERQVGAALHAALLPSILLERFPKSIVEVHLLVLEGDGGELAAGITAASAALVDAGVDLCGVVVASQVGLHHQVEEGKGSGSGGSGSGTGLAVDPTAVEETQCVGLSTVAYMPTIERITYASHSGTAGANDVLQALSLCLQSCKSMEGALRPVLVESVKERLGTRQTQAVAGSMVEG